MGGKESMNVLGERYAVPIIIELDNNGVMKISDFLNLITNYRTLENLCSDLEKNNIITITKEIKHHGSYLLELTDRGRTIAKHLKLANELV